MNGYGLAAVATAIVVVATAAILRLRAARFPLPGETGRRTAAGAVTVLIATLVAATAAATALATRTAPPSEKAPPRTAGTVIALDVSGSLSSGVYGIRLSRALRFAARSAGPTAGLVIFADTAVELLPPSSPVSAAVALARFVTVADTPARDRLSESSATPRTYDTPTPWFDAFVGNTDIASGLSLAERLLRRGPHAGSRIILISDLQDGGVGSTLRRSLARAHRAGIAVTAVPVGSTRADVARWRSAGGAVEHVRPQARAPRARSEDGMPVERSILPAALAVAFAVLLGGLLLWASPLRVTLRAE